MQRVFVIAWLAGVLLLGDAATYACSCIDPPPPLKELKKARAVFVGEVVEVEERIDIDDEYRYIVKFKVERYWKGVKQPEIVILSNLPLGDCGRLYFEAGKKYLVYAFGKQLIAYGCRRTARLASAAEDLNALGAGRTAESLTRRTSNF